MQWDCLSNRLVLRQGWTSDMYVTISFLPHSLRPIPYSIKGLDWVLQNAPHGGASIVNMSLSGPYSQIENDAIKVVCIFSYFSSSWSNDWQWIWIWQLTDAGIHVVVCGMIDHNRTCLSNEHKVAAGNDTKDASGYSPASAPTAIATGSTDSLDTMLWHSNYGNSHSSMMI